MNSFRDTPRTCQGLVQVVAVFAMSILLTVPVMAQIPDGLPERVTDRVLALAFTHDLSRHDAQALLAPMGLALRRDLPLEPMLRKMEEGLAKGVAPERIATALETLTTLFTEFTDILDGLAPHVPRNRDNVLQRMHGLAAMGIGPEIIKTSLDGPLAPSMGQVLNMLETQAGLIQNGISIPDAEGIVNAGLVAGYFHKPGWDLVYLARAARDAGVPREHISASILDVVEGRKDIQALAREFGIAPSSKPGRGRHGAMRHNGGRGMAEGQRGVGSGPGFD